MDRESDQSVEGDRFRGATNDVQMLDIRGFGSAEKNPRKGHWIFELELR